MANGKAPPEGTASLNWSLVAPTVFRRRKEEGSGEVSSSFSFKVCPSTYERLRDGQGSAPLFAQLLFFKSALPDPDDQWFRIADAVRVRFMTSGELLQMDWNYDELTGRAVLLTRWLNEDSFLRFCDLTKLGEINRRLASAKRHPLLTYN
ncbi:MAG: hypothetical protein RBT63_08345 [Bdellovibrionales bacterium]|jgi:hypothetical protein|nr:hypothetical protein [Bdellovibrionales bacterium]